MYQGEWARIVARLNVNWPGQQITKLTADEWFGPKNQSPHSEGTGPLASFPAAEVWEAVDRCRQDLTPGHDGRPRGAWLPNLADILAAIDANWRDRAAQRRELEARQARAARNAVGGVPMPPETKEALQVLKASKSPPGTPDHIPGPLARQRIEALAEQLTARVDLEKLGQLT
jgi:hypothetical protein